MTNLDSQVVEHELSHKLIDAPPTWANELGADLVAGMIVARSTDPIRALEGIIAAPGSSYGYRDACFVLRNIFKQQPDPRQAAKAFLKYASASEEDRPEAIRHLTAELGGQHGEDIVEKLTPAMEGILKYGLEWLERRTSPVGAKQSA